MVITLAPPYRVRCLFCGDLPTSQSPLQDEHVFPNGVRKRMPATKSVQAVMGGTPIGRRSTTLHVVLKEATCKRRCNGGWISRLDKALVRTLGTQLSAPAQRHLDPSQQERVATWAIKTALLLELYTGTQGPSGYAPTDNFRWLAEHVNPPPGARVWLSAIRDPGAMMAHHVAAALCMEVGVPVAYFVTFTLGYLVFQVYGGDISQPEDPTTVRPLPVLNPPRALSQTLTNIWPGNGQEALWPPRRPIEARALPVLSSWPDHLIRQAHQQPCGGVRSE